MSRSKSSTFQLLDYRPSVWDFGKDTVEGFSKSQKVTQPKYFYDERGSSLFEAICGLDEYYVPKKEISIMRDHIDEVCDSVGRGVSLIEYGCGNCAKTRILIDNLADLEAYVPIDISREQLRAVAQSMSVDHPGLEILPVCADYTSPVRLPVSRNGGGKVVVYFPGSSFGNFHPKEGSVFLKQAAQLCGRGGGLLIGLDLKKDPAILHRAYNDSRHVTADFNLNILTRINRELGGDFEPGQYRHYAFYNPKRGRIEMHMVSLGKQTVHLLDQDFDFVRGESIWTESSYKYDLDEFAKLAAACGFRVQNVWTDAQQWFSVQYLVAVQ
jgi:dimethylhistidine N-methyltransferase